jgi:hypothetical protein
MSGTGCVANLTPSCLLDFEMSRVGGSVVISKSNPSTGRKRNGASDDTKATAKATKGRRGGAKRIKENNDMADASAVPPMWNDRDEYPESSDDEDDEPIDDAGYAALEAEVERLMATDILADAGTTPIPFNAYIQRRRQKRHGKCGWIRVRISWQACNKHTSK